MVTTIVGFKLSVYLTCCMTKNDFPELPNAAMTATRRNLRSGYSGDKHLWLSALHRGSNNPYVGVWR